MSATLSDQHDPLVALADEFLDRLRRGERPTLDEYKRRYPDLAGHIEEYFPALIELEQFGSVEEPGSETARPASPAASAPASLGEYMILGEIGRGGMGVVYEAVQQSLGRHVALKVLPAAAFSRTALERFRLEARAAARLHHTNIVPVFGIGEHEGVHYFAMQFIRGQGLNAVIDEMRRLRDARRPVPEGRAGTTREASAQIPPAATLAASLAERRLWGDEGDPPRQPDTETAPPAAAAGVPPAHTPDGPDGFSLDTGHLSDGVANLAHAQRHFTRGVARIGVQVAEALAYAHSQGILHRDIKPSNLLLDTRGTVWVTDFGLAKEEGSDGPTQTGDIVGTLRYMAPERFEGHSGPRSDVYGLGATLYELLTLQTVVEGATRAQVVEQVLRGRATPPRRIDPSIPRDLETIVLKAIAREPAARYDSASAMAEDLRRFLEGRTILARRSGLVERTWRWARRNPVVASLTAAVIVLFLGGFAGVTLQWRRAERLNRLYLEGRREAEENFARARSAVDDYLTIVSESTLLKSPLPGLQPLRRDLLRAALKYYEDFARQHADDPRLRSDLAAAYYRVGAITGDIGSSEEALRSLRQAESLFRELSRERPDDDGISAGYGRCLLKIAILLGDTGRHEESVARYRDAIQQLRDPSARHVDDLPLRGDLAVAYHQASRTLVHLGRYEEGIKEALSAIEIRRDLVKKDPSVRASLASSLSNLAYLYYVVNEQKKAYELLTEADAILKGYVKDHPEDTEARRALSQNLRGLASIPNAAGRVREAVPYFREARDIITRLSAEHPSVVEFRRQSAINSTEFGQVLVDAGDAAGSLAAFAEARENAEIVLRSSPSDLLCLNVLASVHRGTGKVLAGLGKPDEALRSLRQAVAIGEKLRATGDRPLFRYDLACALALCSEMAAQSKESRGEAGRYADQAISTLVLAIEAGWKNFDLMKTDPDLKSLHGREDFRAIIDGKARSAATRSRP